MCSIGQIDALEKVTKFDYYEGPITLYTILGVFIALL